jgi:hypothetical protein
MRMFYETALRKIPGPTREEEIGVWRRLDNEELNNAHSSPDIVRVIRSRKISRKGNATGM